MFKPFVELTALERRQIVTLPATITTLTADKRLVLKAFLLLPPGR
ncbi:hypothetical protein ACGFIE_16370 [Micromonospora sp. NPDC049275]